MNRFFCGLAIFLGLYFSFSLSVTANAKDSRCEKSLQEQARVDRWIAQRQQIGYMEKAGTSFRDLSGAYRSLIQNLFATSGDERVAIFKQVFPRGNILRELDLTLTAPRFTADLIRILQIHYPAEIVLAKLRVFAEIYAEQLSN